MQIHFDDELEGLKSKLLKMGTIAENMIDKAVRGLMDRRLEENYILEREQEMNNLQIEIDEEVIRLIALHQPVATDLRFLIMVSKIGGELERIADQAVNIAQNTRHLLQYPLLKPLLDLPIMADTARQMLGDSIDALMSKDVPLAQKVLDTDDKVDAFKNQIFRELLTYMMSDPGTIQRALSLILISRNLERVGDHCTNIAEEVIYIVQGRDVRHHHEEEKRKEDKK